MIDPITYIAILLKIDPTLVAATIPMIILVANWLSRLIPDNATGVLGFSRSVLKVIGLYASSRVAPGLTVSDISKMVIQPPMGNVMAGKITEHAIDQVMQEAVSERPLSIKNNPFRRRHDGRFEPNEEGFVSRDLLRLMATALLGLGAVSLTACATLSGKETLSYVCKNRETIRAYVDAMAEKLNICPILDNEVR